MSEDLNNLEVDLVRAILTRYHTTRLSEVSAESHVLNGFVVRQALDRLIASRLQAAEERAEKLEGDRDALRAAIGFKPGPLDDDRDNDIVIMDAKALRPAMVEARRQRDAAQSKLWDSHAYAAEVVRAWVKERFGKWITHKTAWTLADRIFGSERAALKTEGA